MAAPSLDWTSAGVARSGLLELHAVAERVVGVEPADARDLAVRPDAGVPRRHQCGRKRVKVVDKQRGVRLAGRSERLLDAEMQDGGH